MERGIGMAAKFEIRSPKAGEFRWVLISQGRTLATGEAYPRRVSCVKAIGSLRKAAPTAKVDDTTLKSAAGKPAAKPPTAAKRTVSKAAKAVEQTAAKTARKTSAAHKRTG
jgi:uncharacterized protein YegP (UPF0339 family)